MTWGYCHGDGVEREGENNHVQARGHDTGCGRDGVCEHDGDDYHAQKIGHDAAVDWLVFGSMRVMTTMPRR